MESYLKYDENIYNELTYSRNLLKENYKIPEIKVTVGEKVQDDLDGTGGYFVSFTEKNLELDWFTTFKKYPHPLLEVPNQDVITKCHNKFYRVIQTVSNVDDEHLVELIPLFSCKTLRVFQVWWPLKTASLKRYVVVNSEITFIELVEYIAENVYKKNFKTTGTKDYMYPQNIESLTRDFNYVWSKVMDLLE